MAISKRKWGAHVKKRKGGMEGSQTPMSAPKVTRSYATLKPIPTPMSPVSAPKVNISAPTPWTNVATGKALKKKKKK